ncbi:phosphotransferase [Paenibacillus sp. LMG 31456]|uniref:Phosphotransferase n=1 Tax=Paenibacillus foliorum TaxID=2654974 RepID=A0A972JZE7_9BACL|nr:phosphotransferase [Paenibacillus foliorum]NOU92665.1 phosphotransferase [Paenibacillus foliorum]
MNDQLEMLATAIKAYGLDPKTLILEMELPQNYHGDRHFKINIDGGCFSARFISDNRYQHDVFVKLTEPVLAEQMRFIDFLHQNNIPFMRRKATASGSNYIQLIWNETEYRFFLFEWMDGRHITHCTETVAYQFGQLARKLHTVSSTYQSKLPKQSHLEGSKKYLHMLKEAAATSNLSEQNESILSNYLNQVEEHIQIAYTTNLEFVMQSDLNPLNILWDEQETITGIIDFEHIGYTDRIEGLAWLIKWYSRTDGLGSHNVSPKLAQCLLEGYEAEDFLTSESWDRLRSLLWLTGCLNWGFTGKARTLITNPEAHAQLTDHLNIYLQRGEKLMALVSQ